MLGAGIGGLVLFVAIVAGAAAGVIDTALGSANPTTGRSPSGGANAASTSGPLRAGAVPAYLIPLFTGAAATSSCGLSPALLAAQSQVESGYQPDAVSSAGAVGIMQFLPSTWAAEGLDADHDGRVSITDPADAIFTAAKLDCENLARIQQAHLGGDPTALMLAAYNAGLGTVLGCRCMPAIQQTRDYVNSILHVAPNLGAAPTPAARTAPGNMVYPLAVRAVVTQGYGPHPGGSFHPGLDLAAAAGTPVLAATAGTVTYAGWDAGYGNYICLAATAALSTCYGHLAVIYIHLGQIVSQGQTLGAEGSTGNSTGPHLHFEVRINGQTVDPAGYLSAG